MRFLTVTKKSLFFVVILNFEVPQNVRSSSHGNWYISFDSQQAAKQIDTSRQFRAKALCQEFLLRQEIKIAENYFFYTLQ